MIPHRIKLTGFLSYKDEQEVGFSTAALWMLAGTNGSGKSSVFDAVTYALFGHHRGGSQNASELINKESNSMIVEFDFKLDTVLYRSKRTLRRSPKGAITGTQQLFRSMTDDSWEPVPDTSKKIDFDKWIHDKIGLNYETFTSSVLLLQGKAEKLLDARPSGRAEVLAGIVDLERYQRLHEKANSRKLELKANLEALSHQTAAVPDVSDLEYATTILQIDEYKESRSTAQLKIDAMAAIEVQARRWCDTQARLAAAKAKLSAAELLLGEAVKIENAYARLQELREVLPAVNTVVSMRGQSQESQRKSDRYLKQREETQERKRVVDHAHEKTKKQRLTVQKQLVDDETKQGKLNARLRELTGLLEKVRLVEQQESEASRMTDDLNRLPDDPEKSLRLAHDDADRLTELSRVLPILERFQTERHELAVSIRTEQDVKLQLNVTLTEGERLKADVAKLQQQVIEAKSSKAIAEQDVAVTKAMADQARKLAAQFASLSGDKTCQTCGQELTAAHYLEEKTKRDQEATSTAQRHREAVAALTHTTKQEQLLTAQDVELKKQLDDLRERYRDQSAHSKQLLADTKRLNDSLVLRYAELPATYQGKIAQTTSPNWSMTTFPERDELIALRRDVSTLESVKRKLREATDTLTKWNQLRARLEVVRETVTKLKAALPAVDLTSIRQEHQSLHAEENTLINSIKAAKANIASLELDVDKLGCESHTCVQILTDLQGKLNTEEVSRQHCDDAAERAKRDLPVAWQTLLQQAALAEYSAWKGESDRLIADGIETKYKQLEQARGGLNTIRNDIEGYEMEAATFPNEARRTPEDVKSLVLGLRTHYEQVDQELRVVQRQKSILDGHREQRAKLGVQYTQIDGEHNKYKLVAELLGRDRLQRHLVRQAERQIVDYANGVLDRLSSGQLFLKLVGSEDGTSTDRALELEAANRVTGGAPINVAFLSGSQRFRVAVSLALGIGQYASKQHRPIESVIIDEGFGCLDRQGRQVMIQELQNLRGHLHCILLVSHQEEFADAFPDGYRFELQNGATKISRFQR